MMKRIGSYGSGDRNRLNTGSVVTEGFEVPLDITTTTLTTTTGTVVTGDGLCRETNSDGGFPL